MPLRCTMTFYGEDGESVDHHKQWYHYLVIANPGTAPGSAVASITTLSDARTESSNAGSRHTIQASDGGAESALKMAEEYLGNHHPGLNKIISRPRG
jgi:hypothetical protein